jgi:multidrug efflux pump subunit AcrA (membrane-fusion protein)
VDTGPIEAVITASGTVMPEVEEVVSSPVSARVLRILKRPGAELQPGDAILELDTSEPALTVAKLAQNLALKQNQQAQTKLALEKQLNDLDSQTKVKDLQLQSLRSQLTRNRQLFEEGLISEEQLRQSELAEAQAVIELKKLEAERTDRIDIVEFVPADTVDFIYIEKTYYIGPDKGGDRAYKLLAEAMTRMNRIAVGRYGTRGKEQLVLVRPYQGGLVVHHVYYADEVRSFDEVDRPGEVEFSDRGAERRLAPAASRPA